MEVIIADGLSTDNTRQEIHLFQQAHPDLAVRVVDNPQRIIPAGLNQALAAAEGDIIVRLDAHSMPREDYVQRCVAAIEAELGDNVGGLWEIQPGGDTWQARSIASAAAHPLGVGDVRYRVGDLERNDEGRRFRENLQRRIYGHCLRLFYISLDSNGSAKRYGYSKSNFGGLFGRGGHGACSVFRGFFAIQQALCLLSVEYLRRYDPGKRTGGAVPRFRAFRCAYNVRAFFRGLYAAYTALKARKGQLVKSGVRTFCRGGTRQHVERIGGPLFRHYDGICLSFS